MKPILRAALLALALISLPLAAADTPVDGSAEKPADLALARARKLLQRSILIDGHNDVPWAIREFKDAPMDVEAYDLRRKTTGQTDLARILRASVRYFYTHFVRGVRRVVVDGIEPTERFSESIQFEFFEYLYHHVLRREDEWAARELFRERYRATEAELQTYVSGLPLWVNVWRGWMFAVFGAALVFVPWRSEARWVALTMVVSLFAYNAVAMASGVGRFPSVAFLAFWTPLALHLARRRTAVP